MESPQPLMQAERKHASQAKFRRGLLKISLPVSVMIAAKKLAVGEILALKAGSIIPFDKSCRAPLELSVGEKPFASGQCVKIGPQLGLRITSTPAGS